VYAVEPFNTTGKSGMIENIPPADSANILRVTGDVKIRKALTKIEAASASMADIKDSSEFFI